MMTKDEIRAQIDGVDVMDGGVVRVDFSESCTLTDQQRADVEAANIISKWAVALPIYLDQCDQLRAADPSMADVVVRDLAKTAIIGVG